MSIGIMHGLGPALRKMRLEAGLSQLDLGRKVGWQSTQVSRYELDRVRLSFPVIEKLAKGMGQRPEVLLLRFLQFKYPKLASGKAGQCIGRAIRELSPTNGRAKIRSPRKSGPARRKGR